MTLWILGGDARSRYCAQFLQENGYSVQTCGVPERSDSCLPETFSCVILPFPSFEGYHLRGHSSLAIEDVLRRTQEKTHIFGAQFGAWQEVFAARSANVHELYGSQPLTTANAVPTAEGAICLAIRHSPITLHGARCLVVGFGCCGKALAQRLQALHAEVTVSVRRSADAALAESMGMRTDTTAVWKYALSKYDFIFNTVPATVFTKAQLDALNDECVIIELASAPGGIPEEERRFLNYHFAPGLPGKFSPKTAGILYAQSILSILEKERLS